MEEIKVDYNDKFEKMLNVNIGLSMEIRDNVRDIKEDIKDLKKYFEYVIQNMEEDDDFIDDEDDEAIEVADDEDEPKPFIKKFSDKGNYSNNNGYKKNIGSNYSNRSFKKAKKIHSGGFSNYKSKN